MGWAFLPDDEVRENKHMAKLKGNLAPQHIKGLKYTTESVTVPMPDDAGSNEENEQPKVKWLGESTVNPDEALSKEMEGNKTESRECKKWLRGFLKDGRKLAGEIIAKGKAEGYSDSTIQKSGRDLRVLKNHEGKQYFWKLGDEEQSKMF
jgi:hypothetical protein